MTEENNECIFCRIVKGDIPVVKVYEDERSLAFADINPVIKGHTLVIPKIHIESILEITPGDLAIVHQTAQKVVKGIKEALKVPGIVLLQLNGKGANQEIMHFHIHLIPRNKDIDGLNFLEWTPRMGNMKKIKKIADKIAEVL